MILWRGENFEPLRKTVAISLSVFVLSNHLLCQAVWASTSSLSSSDRVRSLQLPEQLGHLTETFVPEPSAQSPERLVIHIQDLHTHYGAQRAIAGLIDHLQKTLGVSLVTLEGGVGPADLAFFSAFPEKATTETVTDFFVQQGLFTGPIAYAITHQNAVQLHGVEEPSLYREHLRAWQQGDLRYATLSPTLEHLSAFLKQRQQALYSQPLQAFLRHQQDYEAGQRSLTAYLTDLTALAQRQDVALDAYPTLNTLQELMALERSLDRKSPTRAQQQRLKRLASTLDPRQVATELDRLAHTVKASLVTTDSARQLDQLATRLKTLQDLANTTLSPERWQQYQREKAHLSAEHLWALLTALAAPEAPPITRQDLELLVAQLGSSERFYDLALQRDEALVTTTLQVMEAQRHRVAILVAGGFHTDGITRLLKEREVAYAVITPRAEGEQNAQRYHELLHHRIPSLERLLREFTAPSAHPSFPPALSSRLLAWENPFTPDNHTVVMTDEAGGQAPFHAHLERDFTACYAVLHPHEAPPIPLLEPSPSSPLLAPTPPVSSPMGRTVVNAFKQARAAREAAGDGPPLAGFVDTRPRKLPLLRGTERMAMEVPQHRSTPGITFRAMIFDSDGVIVNTTPFYEQTWREALAPYGLHVTTDIYNRYLNAVRANEAIRELHEVGLLPRQLTEQQVDEIVNWRADRFRELVGTSVPTFDTTRAFMESLRQADIPMAVASASPHTPRLLELVGVTGHLVPAERIVAVTDTELELGLPVKVATFLLAARRLGVPPADMAAIGDTLRDVEAAVGVGCGLIIFVDRERTSTSGQRALEAGAHVVINDLSELTKSWIDDRFAAMENAARLGLDLSKVEALSARNAGANYGASMVAGHPISGPVGETIRAWQAEINMLSGGTVTLNTEASHQTIGAIVRSQSRPIQQGDQGIDTMDFAEVLQAIQEGQSYRVRFTTVEFGQERDGNIVLSGEVIGEGLSRLQRRLAASGLNFKWEPQPPGQATRVYVTLGQVSTEVLAKMTSEQCSAFQAWMAAHRVLEPPLEWEVSEVRIVRYSQRTLERVVSPDLVFRLGTDSGMDAATLYRLLIEHGPDNSGQPPTFQPGRVGDLQPERPSNQPSSSDDVDSTTTMRLMDGQERPFDGSQPSVLAEVANPTTTLELTRQEISRLSLQDLVRRQGRDPMHPASIRALAETNVRLQQTDQAIAVVVTSGVLQTATGQAMVQAVKGILGPRVRVIYVHTVEELRAAFLARVGIGHPEQVFAEQIDLTTSGDLEHVQQRLRDLLSPIPMTPATTLAFSDDVEGAHVRQVAPEAFHMVVYPPEAWESRERVADYLWAGLLAFEARNHVTASRSGFGALGSGQLPRTLSPEPRAAVAAQRQQMQQIAIEISQHEAVQSKRPTPPAAPKIEDDMLIVPPSLSPTADFSAEFDRRIRTARAVPTAA